MKVYNKYIFSGFDWMGQIPSHWLLTKNRYGFQKIDNGFNESDNTPVLSLTIKGIKVKTNLNFGKSSESYIGHQMVKKGDIVFTPRDFDQTPILSDVSEYDGCISNLYIVDKTKENVLNHYVNYYWYGLKYSCDYFKIFSHGMRYSFNRFQFDEIPLLIPPISEQKQIVKFLDEKTSQIDNLISLTEKKIELLKQKRTSLINEVVTKGLNTDVEMKDSGVEWIGEIPKHWEISQIRYLTTILRGQFSHRPRNDERFYNGNYPFIQTGDVVSSGKYLTNYTQTLNDLGYSVSKEFPIGTLVMTISGNVGDVSILKIKSCFPDSIIGFSPYTKRLSVEYLYYVFYVLKGEFHKNSTISTQMNLNVERVGSIKITFPSLSEQKQIVEYIDTHTTETDKLVSIEQRRIETLKEYRQSLISEVVNGKIRVCEESLIELV
jgi:type I restriction enzyme S subunit